MNKLYYGDCLTVMQEHMLGKSVDLVYLDPPFSSNRDYNAIYKDETGRPLPEQLEAFCDLWTLDEDRERALRTMPVLMRESGIDDYTVKFWQTWMEALRNTQPRLIAYLSYMVERLLQIKVVLRDSGSVYLHCDPTASHYIKVMMDAIFGHQNFRNEIIWKRTSGHSDASTLGSVHDTILHYSKSDTFTFNRLFIDYDGTYVSKRHRHKDPDGRRWMDDNLTAKGLSGGGYEYTYRGAKSLWRVPVEKMRELDESDRLYITAKGGIRIKRYLDEMKGVPLNDVWTDIPPINSRAKERLGYQTQKPVALLERIVELSSDVGDVVFDPFCGCATTVEAAHKLNRAWIGVDVAIHAIKRVAQIRLRDRLGLVAGQDFIIDGVPKTLEGAKDLWTRDKHHFQKWAVETVDGFVKALRRPDGGIDGRLFFSVPTESELQTMIIEVKGGKNVSIQHLRALQGVMENEGVALSGLIIMEPLGQAKMRNFERFIKQAGVLTVDGLTYARIQLMTAGEILKGKKFNTPGALGRGLAKPALPFG